MSNPVLEPTRTAAAPRFRRPLVHMALVVGVAGVIAGNGWLKSGSSSAEPEVRPEVRGQKSEVGDQASEPVVAAVASDRVAPSTDNRQLATSEGDEEFLQAVLGTWYVDDYYGRCILDIQEGGKGTMTVVFGSYYAYLLAARVDAVLEWTIRDGRALFKTVSGKPEAAYAIIAREKGEDRDRKIVEIGERRMVLVDDQDDGSVATWTRAKSLAEAVQVK